MSCHCGVRRRFTGLFQRPRDSCQRVDKEAARHQEEVSALNRSTLSENLNDPCRTSELYTMYRELKTQIWARTKEEISERPTSERKSLTKSAKNLIKDTFEEGKKDMILKRHEMDKMLQQINGVPRTAQEKIVHHIQSYKENLKMFFFLHFENINSTSDFKTFVEEKTPGLHKDLKKKKIPGLPEVLHELYVHCYFVSRFMALHDPPIEVCWDRAGVNVFPDL